MPATYAHYKFGKAVYRSLPKEIRQILKENRAAYLLGLHGPDLVFYYRPFGKNRVNQLGVRMHKEKASGFFETGRRRYQERPSYVLLSYLCGFLCHFILDSECHPYIGCYMEEHGLGHLEIETDFDRYLLEKDGFDPTRHCCTRHLIQDLDTEEAIASVFEGLTADQIDQSIRGFCFCIRGLQCPGPAKELFLRTVFALIGQKDNLEGLIMNGVPNPACRESREFLEERMNLAVQAAARAIREYVEGIDKDTPLSPRLDRDYEKAPSGDKVCGQEGVLDGRETGEESYE